MRTLLRRLLGIAPEAAGAAAPGVRTTRRRGTRRRRRGRGRDPDRRLRGRLRVRRARRMPRSSRRYLRGGETVLNIGCGVGRVERYLAPRVGELWAVDVSGEMIRRARERLAGTRQRPPAARSAIASSSPPSRSRSLRSRLFLPRAPAPREGRRLPLPARRLPRPEARRPARDAVSELPVRRRTRARSSRARPSPTAAPAACGLPPRPRCATRWRPAGSRSGSSGSAGTTRPTPRSTSPRASLETSEGRATLSIESARIHRRLHFLLRNRRTGAAVAALTLLLSSLSVPARAEDHAMLLWKGESHPDRHARGQGVRRLGRRAGARVHGRVGPLHGRPHPDRPGPPDPPRPRHGAGPRGPPHHPDLAAGARRRRRALRPRGLLREGPLSRSPGPRAATTRPSASGR